MYYLPLRFISVGADISICATRIIGIFDPGTVLGRRMIRTAKDSNSYYDVRGGRALRSLILMDNDTVVASSLRPITLFRNLEDKDRYYLKTMKVINENVKKKYYDEAAKDGIIVVEKDKYDQLEYEIADPKNLIKKPEELKGE